MMSPEMRKKGHRVDYKSIHEVDEESELSHMTHMTIDKRIEAAFMKPSPTREVITIANS
jgi:hypothetical protein